MSPLDAAAGLDLAHQGRFEEALPHLEYAHRQTPVNLPLLHALASALQATGRRNAAVARYQNAASACPENDEILAGWARACLLAGNPAQATALLVRALSLNPGLADPGSMLDMIVTEINDPDRASNLLRPLLDTHPQCASLILQFAYLATNAEHLADARRAFVRYAELRPDDATPHVELSRLATNRGDRVAALEHLGVALAIDPDDGAALWEQAQIRGGKLDAANFSHIEKLTRRATDARRLAPLHDILSRHFDRTGDYAQAIAHLELVKAYHRELALPQDHYDPQLRERETDVTIELFNPAWFDRIRSAGSPDARPIFIIGMPRSGTTLLQQMLCAHPGITSVGEQTFADASFRRAMMAAGTAPMSQMPLSVVREAADWHIGLVEERLRRLSLQSNTARVIDKLPDNYMFAGWLSAAFPNATIIHCLRDPRDVAISCWRTQFSRINWTRELDHIVHRIEQHRRMMRHWRTTIGARLIELRYENLIADPEPVLRRLLRAIGLEWNAAVLEHTGHKGHIRSASQYQVEAPLDTRSIGRWRNYAFALAPILPRLEAIVAQDAQEATADLQL